MFEKQCNIMIMIFGALVLNDNFSRLFIIFFKILIFWVVMGVKGQKLVQNDQKICPLHSISQEPYNICFSFMVHMCKMIIYSGVFCQYFKILIFWVTRVAKGQIMVQNHKKFCLTHAPYLRSHTLYDSRLWYTCVKW